MYKLTSRMLQHFRNDITKFHALFDGARCSGWHSEELIVKAIKSDTQAQHHVKWKEAGHDDKADIVIHVEDVVHSLQIKSGQWSKQTAVTLSGHRLGRFGGDLQQITDYLNSMIANIILVPYHRKEDADGLKHVYQLCYLDVKYLKGITVQGWQQKGEKFEQTNQAGVLFSLRPSMSWQIWWIVPAELLEKTDEFTIG